MVTDIPDARVDEPPAEYAARLARRFVSSTSMGQRRALGQFFTPVEVARFIASLAAPPHPIRSILDPGAGTGILSCALCETLAPKTQRVHLDAYEVDRSLAASCNRSLLHAKAWLANRGVSLTYSVHMSDFILERAASLEPGLFDGSEAGCYDLVIANPPYFKLQKTDPRSVAASVVIHGQPNIYSIFMAISASLLAEGGVMVTITPRSFATGDYFSRCRRYLFSRVVPEAVHLFDSRKEAFKNDAVLQENVILRARKTQPQPTATVHVSKSHGPHDIETRKSRTVRLASVVEISSPRAIFHIPAEDTDEAIVRFVRQWPNTLCKIGLEVSTGPVVAFRARRLLVNDPTERERSVPLLWLQNVRPMTIEWPLSKRAKPQYIVEASNSNGLLIPNKTYVVLRRFSAKEERRRLTAAPLTKGFLPGRMIGLENHLNYIHRPHGQIEEEEAFGLAALLGCTLLDRYFRISNGNTQVNATELRALPVPPRATLIKLGQEVRCQLGLPIDIDLLSEEVLGVPKGLRRLLKAG